MAAQYNLEIVGNYLVVNDLLLDEEIISLPYRDIYYTIEKRDGDFSDELFFNILGGFGGTTKSGGLNIINENAEPNITTIAGNSTEELISFLRNNTGGPTIA
jgi:hypothetical protein